MTLFGQADDMMRTSGIELSPELWLVKNLTLSVLSSRSADARAGSCLAVRNFPPIRRQRAHHRTAIDDSYDAQDEQRH